MNKTLVIVRCGEQQDAFFPSKAKDAYTHHSFQWYRKYAEKFGDHWVILSTLKGLVDPEQIYDAPYNEKNFNISGEEMQKQIKTMIEWGIYSVIKSELRLKISFIKHILQQNLNGIFNLIHKQ